MENLHQEKTEHLNHLWEESRKSSVIKDLKNGLSFQEIVAKQEIGQTSHQVDHVECSDGRCPHHGDELSFAGSGILLSDEDFDKLIKAHPEVKCLTSHDDCGASKLAFAQREKADTLPAGVTTPAQLAERWAREKAMQYGLSYKHITVNEFNDQDHHEVGIVLDATKKFHPTMIKDLPNVFVSNSADCLADDYTGQELAILTSIALGDHGFGERITEADPFYIFVCARDEEEEERLVYLAKKSVADYGAKVNVQGFVL